MPNPKGAPLSVPDPKEKTEFTFPPPLKAGDRVALFHPGSHGGKFPPEWPGKALDVLKSWGLQPEPLPPEAPRHFYLSGTDPQRAEAFQALYCDPEIKALFAARGGYGTARMLPLLDAGLMAAAAPKAVVGMSDVSALFVYLHDVAGVGAIHGPCLAAPGVFDSPTGQDNLAHLKTLLFNRASPPPYPCTVLHAPSKRGFRVTGPLLGGNLTVLAAGLGTPWALDTRGAILFFEDVNEAVYRLDRCLTQFRQAGRFDHIAALVFGSLTGRENDPPGLLESALDDLFSDAPFPVAVGLPAGHGPLNRALPLGRTTALAAESGDQDSPATLEIL